MMSCWPSPGFIDRFSTFRLRSKLSLKRRSPMPTDYFEEEEFEAKFTGRTFARIWGLLIPHKKWVIAFLSMIAVVSIVDAMFTYISKIIIDSAVLAKDVPLLYQLLGL